MKKSDSTNELKVLGYVLIAFGTISGAISSSMIYYGIENFTFKFLFLIIDFFGILIGLFFVIFGLILLFHKDKNAS